MIGIKVTVSFEHRKDAHSLEYPFIDSLHPHSLAKKNASGKGVGRREWRGGGKACSKKPTSYCCARAIQAHQGFEKIRFSVDAGIFP